MRSEQSHGHGGDRRPEHGSREDVEHDMLADGDR
jgi:hypothetical protein